jgi:predicted KAP-like P-loop ATPase
MLPFVGAGAKTLAEQFGRQLSEVRLEERRKQIFEIMRDAKRTVIVLIDDLDRLDGNEIATMLKEVRLTANIPNVVYVLAFDDEVVAHALSPVYGKYHEAGRLFLEKVIQFPFVIPAVGQDRLADYVLRHARDAAQRAGIVMHDADWSAFRDLTSHHLSRRLTTPRQAIRYGSALDFALPMLRGEVNPLQQLVVEAIRILFPELYVHIRDNRNAFIGDNISEEG